VEDGNGALAGARDQNCRASSGSCEAARGAVLDSRPPRDGHRWAYYQRNNRRMCGPAMCSRLRERRGPMERRVRTWTIADWTCWRLLTYRIVICQTTGQRRSAYAQRSNWRTRTCRPPR